MYFVVSSDMSTTPLCWNNDNQDIKFVLNGNCFRTVEEARSAAEKVKALLLSLHYNGTSTANSETLKGTFTECLKKFAEHHADVILQKARERRLSEQYNNAPEGTKLPDWCKVGEWVYCTKTNNYGKILSVDKEEVNICIPPDGTFSAKTNMMLKYGRTARLRSYNAEEMKALVGKVIERHSSAYLVISYAHDDLGTTVYIEGKYLSADNLLRDFTINNAPCGVLEHLENGEWVE